MRDKGEDKGDYEARGETVRNLLAWLQHRTRLQAGLTVAEQVSLGLCVDVGCGHGHEIRLRSSPAGCRAVPWPGAATLAARRRA